MVSKFGEEFSFIEKNFDTRRETIGEGYFMLYRSGAGSWSFVRTVVSYRYGVSFNR